MSYIHHTASAFTIGDRVELIHPISIRRGMSRGNVTNTTAHFVLVSLDRLPGKLRVYTPSDLRIIGEA